METVSELRQKHRKLRAALAPEKLELAAIALCQRIIALDVYQQAERVAAYFAVNGEIGLDSLIGHALQQGKQIYLPNLSQQALRFAPYFHDQKMRINKYRLPEPDVAADELLAPEALDLVLAPLVVFDVECNRIGMGGGFYDRSFAFRKSPETTTPVLVGVAHELQKVDRLIPEKWDVRLDMIVTDQTIYE